MTANQVFWILLTIWAIGAFALMPVSLRLGLKLVGIADISSLKAFGLYLLILIVSFLIAVAVIAIALLCGFKGPTMAFDILGYALQFAVPCLIVALGYRVHVFRSAKAVFPFFLAGIATVLSAYAWRTFAYEAFLIPTNAMAPTLLGEHWESPCPKCGAPAFGSPPLTGRPVPPDGLVMICSKEFRTVYVTTEPMPVVYGDRILVCKLLPPKRWDLIVFKTPADASVVYAKRLVGLPGEKLEIREGAIWINDKKLDPPDEIRGIHYSATIKQYGQTFAGPGSRPLELGPDEYFVLGDFVDCSADSRMWEQGAPGHPPYAVPASHIVGTVINTYWPPNRWRGFR
jgi:signal peptidase I